MKKNKLLLAAAALMLGGSVWAQDWTDKTDLITNPSFETDGAISDLTQGGSSTKVAPTGWTVTYDTGSSNANTQQWGTANSSSKIQGIGSSHAPSDGDKYYYIRENWHGSTTYSVAQTISAGSIPAGFYRLSVKLANFASTATDYTLSIQEGNGTEVKKLENTTGSSDWQDWSVIAYKASDETSLTIKASMKGGSAPSSHWCLLLDDITLEYLAASSVSSTNTVDITSCIVNPSFEWGSYNGTKDAASSIEQNAGGHKYATGWTFLIKQTGWSNVANVTDAPADGSQAYETWAGNPIEFKVYQTLSTLPEGVYEISASARTENSTANDICTYATVGGSTIYSDPFDVSNIQSPWNGSANWQTLTARFSIVGSGTPEVGIHSTKFMQFDNFHLTYFGNNLLLTDLKSQFNTWKATATSDLGSATYTNVTGSERTALTSAKDATPEETVAAWNTAITTLRDAIDTFEAAKTNYDLLATEITKATALGIDASSYAATSETTAATALTNTQSLKENEYTYVTSEYQHSVTLGTWTATGPTGSLSGQHYKGSDSKYSYLEQSSEAWATSSWTIKYAQDLTLPAGNYVFKVAGRQAASDGVTLALTVKNGNTVLGTVNDFPRGDTGLGINTSGETDFTTSEGHEYVNGGAGRGWEWRYVKFTLTGDATVNVSVDAVATTSHMWVSFCDATVQTDDEKNISLIAYNIALASAQTTIADDENYSNVTGSERNTLQGAIDADEDLDKEDKDAIDAATTALSNATTAFVNAKDAYDAYVAAKAVVYEDDLPYASSTKFAAIATAQGVADATSASDATSKTNAIISAYRKYVESNALAEGVDGAEDNTSLISDPNMDVTYDGTEHTFGAWQVFSQTDGTISLKTEEDQPLTDGDGNKYKYADIWKSDNNGGIKQTLSNLPAGKYLLTVAARAQNAAGATFGLFAGNARTEIPKMDATGGVFGNGWNDVSLEFFVTATTNVEIGVQSGNGKTMWWGATRFRLVRLGDASESVTVTSAGYATYASDYPLDYTDSGIEAYIATTRGDGTGVSFSQINKVPAGTGVLLYKAGGVTEKSIPFFSDDADGTSGNVFVRGTGATVASEEGEGETAKYNYILNKVRDVIGFYKAAGNTVATNRAYISILKSESKSADVKGFFALPGMDDADGISTIENGQLTIDNAPIYNLAGQRMNKVQKGINIVNGKKILY